MRLAPEDANIQFMSALLNLVTRRLFRLPAHARLGRGLDADILEPGEHASRHHAVLSWNDGRWWLRDERSRNGTWVDRRALGQAALALGAGQRIGLGRPEPGWELVDEAAPRPFARREDREEEIEARDGVIRLPGPEGALLLDYDATRMVWVRQDDPLRVPLQDRARISLDVGWDLFLYSSSDATLPRSPPWDLTDVLVTFRLSRDLEHTALGLRSSHGADRWLAAMEIFWPLYILARARLADVGVAEHDQGWLSIDELSTQSGLPRKTLDIYIIRLRERLSREGVSGAESIVQVRRGQRRIGVGPHQIRVEEGL